MVSPLKLEARPKADKNRVACGSMNVSLFRVHRTISTPTIAIPATALRWHRVQPSCSPTQEAIFIGDMKLTRAGATAAVKQVFRLDATKTGPPPAPTADVFCTVRATHSPGLSS